MSLVFLVAKQRNRYDIVDVAWGLAFIAIAAVSVTGQDSITIWSTQSLVVLLVLAWGLRLSVHIYRRWQKNIHEDKRYAELRKQYARKPGGLVSNMYLRVFFLQAVLATIIMLPVILLSATETGGLGIWALVGMGVWLVGFYFEVAADSQLSRHIRKGKKALLTSGVWRLSRHPNYFGEATMWWGIWICTIGTPYVWWALISPVVITILVRFVSGVPLTEKLMSKRDGWSDYVKKTSIFLPLPPKKR